MYAARLPLPSEAKLAWQAPERTTDEVSVAHVPDPLSEVVIVSRSS